MHVDGGKNLSVRGQHTWYGMQDDQNRGFEIGESTSVIDFFKMKMRPRTGSVNGKIIDGSNDNVH